MDQRLTTVPDYDDNFRSRTDADGKVVTKEGMAPYFSNLSWDHWPAEGQSLKLISMELFQSINPLFVILLTPPVVWFFGFLRQRGKEPATPAKIMGA